MPRAKPAFALIALALLGVGGCAPDSDLQRAQQNVDIARAKLAGDRADGNPALLTADAQQLAQAQFVLKYDRLQWPGDSLGHGAHHSSSH